MTPESTIANSEALEPPYSHQVNAAWGWLELGNVSETQSELADLPCSIFLHPDVLMIRWELCSTLQDWDRALGYAQLLAKICPDCPDSWIKQSYALHELKRTQEAWDTLLRVSDQFERCPTIAYNLACYACQLDRCAEAESWLRKAVQTGKKACIKKMALEDHDLTPMRDFVQSM